MLGWLVRLLLAVLLLRAVWSFFASLVVAARGPARRPASGGGPSAVSLVRDPVCGTFVEPRRALSEQSGAEVHYFCSESCRRTFRQSA
jgi:YHS domain-containing protein